jgi:hypothetical protein
MTNWKTFATSLKNIPSANLHLMMMILVNLEFRAVEEILPITYHLSPIQSPISNAQCYPMYHSSTIWYLSDTVVATTIMIRKIALNRKEELLVPCDVESKASPVTREKSSSLVEVARRSAKTSSLQTLAAITLGYLIGFGHLSRNSFSSPAAFTCATTKERNKRPLQIFPLLKELKSGWANMQVRIRRRHYDARTEQS